MTRDEASALVAALAARMGSKDGRLDDEGHALWEVGDDRVLLQHVDDTLRASVVVYAFQRAPAPGRIDALRAAAPDLRVDERAVVVERALAGTDASSLAALIDDVRREARRVAHDVIPRAF